MTHQDQSPRRPWPIPVIMLLAGCSGTIPVTQSAYIPQNFTRYEGRVSIGEFTYEPARRLTHLGHPKIAPNQLENTAVGSIYLSANVSDLVQRATALELEKTGFSLSGSNAIELSGDVLEFKADDLGYSVDWTYSIRYTIRDRRNATVLLNKV